MEKSYPVTVCVKEQEKEKEKEVLPKTNGAMNKREEANDKMSERHLIGQCVQNPFLARNDYTKDIATFLRPSNTSVIN